MSEQSSGRPDPHGDHTSWAGDTPDGAVPIEEFGPLAAPESSRPSARAVPHGDHTGWAGDTPDGSVSVEEANDLAGVERHRNERES